MKIETKYEIGQEVWVMTMGNPYCTTITAIHIDKNGLSYNLRYLLAREEERIFPTKEELLKSL